MGACYNTILVPKCEREQLVANIDVALNRLGCRIVHLEEPVVYENGFHYRSNQVIFIASSQKGNNWIPLSSWGQGLSCEFPEWYTKNPLALSLSNTLSPVLYLFTYDTGFAAGYSIFKDGNQVTAETLEIIENDCPAKFLVNAAVLRTHELAVLLNEPDFTFRSWMNRFKQPEIAIAALAARFGVLAHLIDPNDVQDGDGAIFVENEKYTNLNLQGWTGVYYEQYTS